MSLLERVYAFHRELVAGRYPNATTLIHQFEISSATARRDISYLRDRLLAPLAFDQQKNGFYYTQKDFDLPFTESPKLIFLLAMINKLAGEAGLADLPEIRRLEERLSGLLFSDYPTLIASIFCEWIEVESIDTTIFSTIIEAVVGRRLVVLSYASVRGEISQRSVEPQRLCNYQGRWYLLAFCRLRRSLRLFHLARIQAAALGSEKIVSRADLDDGYLQASFGIFKGEPLYRARILFTGTAAELVRHQHWHRRQILEEHPAGICLSLPVSDDREIVMKVLQYGAMAEVLEPAHLRATLSREIARMMECYRPEAGAASLPPSGSAHSI